MTLTYPSDATSLHAILQSSPSTVIVGFFGEFSEASRRAQPEFVRACESHSEWQAFAVDVTTIKGAHTPYGVDSVPTIVVLKNGHVLQTIVGVRAQDQYEQVLSELANPRLTTHAKAAERRAPHVTVYSTPSCPWCVRVKNYLRQHSITFSDVDVSRDEAAARRMVSRSGQQGVPQVDINGRMIVGFDKPKIDQLLGLSGAA